MSPAYDHDADRPPTLYHRIHEELVAHEVEHGPSENAREAQNRVTESHGPPARPTVRPHELEERCSEGVCRRVHKVLGGGRAVVARCDVCPRPVNAMELFDLRDLREPVRSRIEEANLGGSARPDEPGAPPGTMPAYACSGCWTRWVREGVMTKSEWIEAHGGPHELVERLRGTPADRRP